MLKKALLWDEDRNQIESRTGFLQFYVKTKKVCRCSASFSSDKKHLTHGMLIAALICPSDVKKIELIMCYGGRNAKVFKCSIPFANTVVVRSRSSSFEYIIWVHAGAERNVCNIVVSAESPTNFQQSISNAAPRVQTSTLTPAPPTSSPPRPPPTFSSAFCATDVSIRSRLPAQIYLKCISFIYMYICVSAWKFW